MTAADWTVQCRIRQWLWRRFGPKTDWKGFPVRDSMNHDSWGRFKVVLHSTPSPAYTFYEGSVTVMAADEEHAKERAVGELKRGAFPERSRDCWVIDRVERIG